MGSRNTTTSVSVRSASAANPPDEVAAQRTSEFEVTIRVLKKFDFSDAQFMCSHPRFLFPSRSDGLRFGQGIFCSVLA